MSNIIPIRSVPPLPLQTLALGDPEQAERMLGGVDTYEWLQSRDHGAMPSARAGQATPRAVLRRLGHSVPITIAIFCVLYFGAEFLR